jgi:hypothetical protein
VWSWMVIGYENQVLAAGQTGDLSAAKLLVGEWDRWAPGPGVMLDSADNPEPIAVDCTTCQPVWPRWPGWPAVDKFADSRRPGICALLVAAVVVRLRPPPWRR